MCDELLQLKKNSAQIRIDMLKMFQHITYGHLGGSMSIVEILSVLYYKKMNYSIDDIQNENRDYLVLSKGHAGPCLYTVLANVGFFDKKELLSLNQGGTMLPSHPDRLKTPGVDVTTGSLGQGCSIAAGLGYGIKLKKSEQKVYLIVGDGELNEGQCWEAFQFIAHHKLHQVVVIIDENKKQLDGYTKDIINPFDLKQKMESFGFYTKRVRGNDEADIIQGLEQLESVTDQGVCLILDTIKGQGISYFENFMNNHSIRFSQQDNDEINNAIAHLNDFVERGELDV
ncbi:MAG: transketolase [Culicoidibacterales bacterium]